MIKMIEIESLSTGMHLHGLMRSSGAPYLLDHMHVVSCDDELALYTRNDFKYAYVFSDEGTGTGSPKPPVHEELVPIRYDKETRRAKRIKSETASIVKRINTETRSGKAVDGAGAKEVLSSMVESLLDEWDNYDRNIKKAS